MCETKVLMSPCEPVLSRSQMESLPPELVHTIIRFVSWQDIKALMAVSSTLYYCLRNLNYYFVKCPSDTKQVEKFIQGLQQSGDLCSSIVGLRMYCPSWYYLVEPDSRNHGGSPEPPEYFAPESIAKLVSLLGNLHQFSFDFGSPSPQPWDIAAYTRSLLLSLESARGVEKLTLRFTSVTVHPNLKLIAKCGCFHAGFPSLCAAGVHSCHFPILSTITHLRLQVSNAGHSVKGSLEVYELILQSCPNIEWLCLESKLTSRDKFDEIFHYNCYNWPRLKYFELSFGKTSGAGLAEFVLRHKHLETLKVSAYAVGRPFSVELARLVSKAPNNIVNLKSFEMTGPYMHDSSFINIYDWYEQTPSSDFNFFLRGLACEKFAFWDCILGRLDEEDFEPMIRNLNTSRLRELELHLNNESIIEGKYSPIGFLRVIARHFPSLERLVVENAESADKAFDLRDFGEGLKFMESLDELEIIHRGEWLSFDCERKSVDQDGRLITPETQSESSDDSTPNPAGSLDDEVNPSSSSDTDMDNSSVSDTTDPISILSNGTVFGDSVFHSEHPVPYNGEEAAAEEEEEDDDEMPGIKVREFAQMGKESSISELKSDIALANFKLAALSIGQSIQGLRRLRIKGSTFALISRREEIELEIIRNEDGKATNVILLDKPYSSWFVDSDSLLPVRLGTHNPP